MDVTIASVRGTVKIVGFVAFRVAYAAAPVRLHGNILRVFGMDFGKYTFLNTK